jgi:hypothetical protein
MEAVVIAIEEHTLLSDIIICMFWTFSLAGSERSIIQGSTKITQEKM